MFGGVILLHRGGNAVLRNQPFDIINKHFTNFAIGIAKTNGYCNQSNVSTRS